MAPPPTIFEVLLFHKSDRALYLKLITLISYPNTARNILALWLWLEFIGIDIIARVRNSNDDSLILRFIAEANTILRCLRQDASPLSDQVDIPLTASLVAEQLGIRFFHYNRDAAVEGIAHFMDGVGKLICDEGLQAAYRAYEEAVMEAERRGRSKPRLPTELDRAYSRDPLPTPEDRRSVFISFARGFPIGYEEIAEYFMGKWGECLEKVMIERTQPGVLPMYGRIVFISESYIDLVFKGEQLFNFVINGKPMWARKFAAGINI